MDNSKFHLWRASFSFCFVDGVFSPEERQWVESKLENIPFSPEQKHIIQQDLSSPPDIEALLSQITSPADRGMLINNMRLLARLDGSFSSSEREKVESLREEVLGSLDLNAAVKAVQDNELSSYHEEEVYKVYNKKSLFEKILRNLQKAANPGEYKFPSKG